MEKEIKIRLARREDYERLEACLGRPHREVEQVNFYLETPALELRERRVMARLRQQDGRLRLTAKWGARHDGGYFEAHEEEADLRSTSPQEALRSGEAGRLLAEHCPPARDAELESLEILGSLSNLRRTYRLAGLELELDHSRYENGSEDFELECETEQPDAARAAIEQLLERAGAQAEPQSRTKFERFLDHLERTEYPGTP